MLTVADDLGRPLVSRVVSEELGHAVHLCQRRIVRMQRQSDVGLLGDGQHGFEEVRVIGPNLFSRILAVGSLLFDLFTEIV